jgi:hypothetical protein
VQLRIVLEWVEPLGVNCLMSQCRSFDQKIASCLIDRPKCRVDGCACGPTLCDTFGFGGRARWLVGGYFLMLAEERADRDYNKSDYHRNVIAAIGRKPGSIERKLQNVSAKTPQQALLCSCHSAPRPCRGQKP